MKAIIEGFGCSGMESQRLQMARPKQSDYDPDTGLTTREIRAVECLLARGPDESLNDVATRAAVTVRTLHRYLSSVDFLRYFKLRVEMEMGGHRARVADALVRGATAAGSAGQAAMQKIYWQRLGELNEKVELTGANGGPIESRSRVKIDTSDMTMEEKVAMVGLIERLGIKPPKPSE